MTGEATVNRYREFGLVSEQDELFRRAFRDGFKRAGLSYAQFLDALGWYRDHVRPDADEAQLAEAFSQFAAERGWPAAQRDGALDLYRAVRDDGPAAATTALRPEEDRATLARADALLRSDPARYWRDGELQDAVFEARERLAAADDAAGTAGDTAHAPARGLAPGERTAPPRRNGEDGQRIAEIEALLHDPSGDGQRRYWNDAGLRTDYAAALLRQHGAARHDGGAAAPMAAASDAAGEGAPPEAA
jgi:hypothetical protein